ncbi:MAG: hypothetical protein ACYSOJ_10140 [Planctomycetota bacterium]|jgi:hypothetical protein
METKTDSQILESPDTHKVFLTGPSVFKTGVERLSKIKKSRALFKYSIGIIGAGGIGWLTGFCLGHIFLDVFEPSRHKTFESVEYWYSVPLTFGHCGAILAAILSVATVYLLSLRRIRHRVEKDSPNGTNDRRELGNVTEACSVQMGTA